MKKIIKVSGMMCAACSGRLERALKATEGIAAVEVSLDKAEAILETNLSDEALKNRISEIGFTPGDITAE